MNRGSSGASYCNLELFHDSVDPNTEVASGHISRDGHQFDCAHYGSYHIVFVIDKSGSMSSDDIKPDDRCGSAKIIQSHDNRLGAVYECIEQFILTRCGPDGSAHEANDIMSFILFDSDAHIIMERQTFVDNDELMETLCKQRAHGGTRFDKAIVAAGKLIEKHQRNWR